MVCSKLISLACILFIVATPFLPTLTPAFATPTNSSGFGLPAAHLISGISYVAQDKMNFCVYACLAMIFNHLGLNTSIDELAFYDGVGYIHSYIADTRLPQERLYGGMDFIASVFGLAQHSWRPTDENLSADELWNQFYSYLRENISQDIPVATGVNPFSLPSLRDQFPINDLLWKTLLPSGRHVILIIGYNDTNHSVCYNDPNAGYYGDGRYGDHAWMPLSTLRNARETGEITFSFTYTPESPPLTKEAAFQEAFQRNINALAGNVTDFWPGPYGINATAQMFQAYTPGANTSQETIRLYKAQGKLSVSYHLNHAMHRLCELLAPGRPNVFDIILAGEKNPFHQIAVGKHIVTDYLENCTVYPGLCMNQSILLRGEAAAWDQLAANYTIFLKRGVFLFHTRATLMMKNMETLSTRIIDLEHTLIDSAG